MPLRSLIFLSLSLVACATAGSRSVSGPLEGRRWQLAEVGGRAATSGAPAQTPYIRFVADSSRVDGSGGCNRFSGKYTRTGDAIEIGSLLSTMMACADNRLNEQERDFNVALSKTKRFVISGDTLELRDANSTKLASLVATP